MVSRSRKSLARRKLETIAHFIVDDGNVECSLFLRAEDADAVFVNGVGFVQAIALLTAYGDPRPVRSTIDNLEYADALDPLTRLAASFDIQLED